MSNVEYYIIVEGTFFSKLQKEISLFFRIFQKNLVEKDYYVLRERNLFLNVLWYTFVLVKVAFLEF